MTLADPEVQSLLAGQFVLGFTNIEKASFVGLSHGYRCDQSAVGTTNGAGGRNVQIVVMAADRTVLHVLPGFWHPEDLRAELDFARTLFHLWLSDDHTHDEKLALFTAMHRARVRSMPAATIARSGWQDFDRWEELQRSHREQRDTLAFDDAGEVALDHDHQPAMKPICLLLHERMASQPFAKLGVFDMEHYVDYGRAFYDNNAGFDRGREFPAAAKSNERRAAAMEKAEKATAKVATPRS